MELFGGLCELVGGLFVMVGVFQGRLGWCLDGCLMGRLLLLLYLRLVAGRCARAFDAAMLLL